MPTLHGDEWALVKECLESGWVSSAGSCVGRFEEAVAAWLGVRHAVATVNGTAALHLALLVAGVEPEDEVAVSTLTFIAPVNAIRYVGAWPVFIDAEPTYWQMDPQRLAEFLDQGCRWREGALYNAASGRRVKAVLPVHVLGHPCDMAAISELAQRYELTVVEDATESLGARCHDRPTGRWGHVGCLSFNGNKVITAGGGGMLVTDRADWAQRARYVSTQAKDDPVEYIHHAVGYNYRLTNLQAALGWGQLQHLDEHVAAKRRIAASYRTSLDGLSGVTPMQQAPWALSTSWLFTVLIDAARYSCDSRQVLRALAGRGIETRPLWQPIHQAPPYQSCQHIGGVVAERLWQEALSLPSSVSLTEEQCHRVAQAVRELARR